MNLYEFLSSAFWPIVVLVLGLIYKKSIDQRKTVEVEFLQTATLRLGEKQAEGDVGALIKELNKVFDSRLKRKHKDFLIKLVESGGEPTVEEAIPEFDRTNPNQLGMLRALRGLGIIHPAGYGKWESNKAIIVDGLGRELYKQLTK
ncbi:MAG: Unknown protein [uncultured Thiotrichaceae bacterium]|uniref:Uncharacterized protein n=1 Tax=uncultured Thiotrichaceae bacterium TaxID=298394 RepID=A0A6S6SXZ5_9GAMM|nr:MAG: Unknown protein [uncultured Thiotrichaceae bacterium]